MEDLISIILPVYNGEKYLSESIESVICQTYKNWELLIIDDGSTDSTAEIARDYAQKDKRIRYYPNDKNMRLPRSLNRGFMLSQGNYLTWTSDDNRYLPEALYKMHEALKANNANFVFASCRVINEAGEGIEYMMTSKKRLPELIGKNIVGACFMYTRKAYNEIGMYDPEYTLVEDFDYWQRLYARFGAVVISEILYEYRWHEKALTNTMSKTNFYIVLEKMLLKNYSLFRSPDNESKYYFYGALYKARHARADKKNPYKRKYVFYSCLHVITKRIPGKIGRIVRGRQ